MAVVGIKSTTANMSPPPAGSVNSIAAMTEATPDPKGGVIARTSGTRKPNGIVEEQAWMPVFYRIYGKLSRKMYPYLEAALDIYSKAGYTTVQDGAAGDPRVAEALKAIYSERGHGPDVINFTVLQSLPEQNEAPLIKVNKTYDRAYRNGGVKLILDGGSPGRTAYLREPCYVQRPGESQYRGYPHTADQQKINDTVAGFYARNVPVNIHALGDAALDMGLEAVEKAEALHGRDNRRTNLIHLQVVGEDQIKRMATLDVTATFQATHNYYFGDLHIADTFGPERAARLNPLNSMLKAGVTSTIHHDAPVHPVDQLLIIWAAVNRVTLSGVTIGPKERVSVMDALKASTINAAYQYFEEDTKGSIEVGKLADFVILDADPTAVDPMEIKDIKVLKTIKTGRTIYSVIGSQKLI